jgi:hypothetical protein
MSAIRGSAPYEGLLPFEPSDEPPPVRRSILENDPLPNRQPSLRKRASRALSRFLAMFCVGIGTTLAFQSYGDVAREMIANSYPQLGWLAPRSLPSDQNAPSMVGLATRAAPSFDQHELTALSLDAMRQSVDRIAAGQELIVRSIDQMTAGQGQMTHSVDRATTSIAQAGSANASDIRVESSAIEASMQPTLGSDIKSAEARLPQTLSETEKQPSAASGYDPSCFASASAVVQHHQGAWPSWTLKAPGHEGTMCWYASARPRHRDHRSEIMPRREIVGMTEKGPLAPAVRFAPPVLAYSRAPWLFAPPALSYAGAPVLSPPPALSHSRPPE